MEIACRNQLSTLAEEIIRYADMVDYADQIRNFLQNQKFACIRLCDNGNQHCISKLSQQ